MQRRPHFGTNGCLLVGASALFALYLFYVAVNCSEGGDCPAWSTTTAAGVLFSVSLAVTAIGLLYASAERILTGTPRQRRFAIAIVVLFLVVALLPAAIIAALSARR